MTKTQVKAKPKIAFVGLGAMGRGMAIQLLKDGFPVCGFDVNPMSLETLLAMGGTAASSPRECVQDADVFICMVVNSVQTEEVFFTEAVGAVFGLKKNAIIILCSTVAPSFPLRLLDQIHQQFSRPDIRLVDCPVSGGVLRAAQGTLTIMSSGPQDALKLAHPTLKPLSQALYTIDGGLGSANKVKLINQHLAGVHIAIAAEAMGLAATVGLNTKQFYETVLKGPAHSWMFENRVPRMLCDDWSPHSALSIFVKDMRIVTSEGLNENFPLYIASAVESLYQFAARTGYYKEDDSGLVRIFTSQGLSLVSTATHQKGYTSDHERKTKLICQMLEIVHGITAVEALALGSKLGLSLNALNSIISNAAGASKSFKVVAATMMGQQSTSTHTLIQSRDILVSIICLAPVWHLLIRSLEANHNSRPGLRLPSPNYSYIAAAIAARCGSWPR
ncbi:putative 3-hydroxyisobutyrate dehydrogenase [Aspergillus uvarum CBS 121591]|uniref:Putative 3-hydroxyisobutyrate dehydrogenase n=1 Tax=Aspergillus uvarum CBS 121591 TaxID=1448315 RepID=A0A319D445_9EURO|nr:putative 3-hydroxyisobutyrate dehydrogenase [Aspergillus uvarum CBS 121591]PYH85793.1 putative 3-hydroxyisobutyrate dehydrogenase [Aspergillus uvarum CBS 121591]